MGAFLQLSACLAKMVIYPRWYESYVEGFNQ